MNEIDIVRPRRHLSVGDEYVATCNRLKCHVDPSVLTCLVTEWNYIKCSNDFSLLPLLLVFRKLTQPVEDGCLSEPNFEKFPQMLEVLRVTRGKNKATRTHLADSNARVIAEMISLCPNLHHIDIHSMGLGPFGASQIVRSIRISSALRYLDIEDNPGIAPAVGDGTFGQALEENSTLEVLNISNNRLDFSSVEKLRRAFRRRIVKAKGKAKHPRPCLMDHGNNVFEEAMNAITHGVGLIFSVVGAIVLMYYASAPHQSRRTWWATLVYCMCLVLLFSFSTALHSFYFNKTCTTVFGLLDHAAIYFLIAGTYFPFCIISLENHPFGDRMAIIQWSLAAVGIIFCIVDERLSIPFKTPFELSLYVFMGWMLVFVWEDVQRHISQEAVQLLAIGGGFYTGGILFFIMDRIQHPIYHAVWHIFVLAGATCHYFAVLLFVVGIEAEEFKRYCIGY